MISAAIPPNRIYAMRRRAYRNTRTRGNCSSPPTAADPTGTARGCGNTNLPDTLKPPDSTSPSVTTHRAPANGTSRAPALFQNHRKLARSSPGNLPDHRQPHRQHRHDNRAHRPRRPRSQRVPHKDQTHETAEGRNPDQKTRVPRRVELHDRTGRWIGNFITAS